jgi:hypothetical protein
LKRVPRRFWKREGASWAINGIKSVGAMVKTAFSQPEETVLVQFLVIKGKRNSFSRVNNPSQVTTRNTSSFSEHLNCPHFSSTAMHSISTSTFFGKVFTATQLLAGFGSPKA